MIESTNHRRRVLLLAGVLALLVGIALYFALRSDSRHGLPVPVESRSASSTSSSPEPTETQAERVAQPASGAEAAPRSAPLHGRVVEDTFGTPLVALVEPDQGTSVLTSGETGAFELGATQACKVLRVSAAHFQEAQASAELARSTEGVEIRMHAKSSASVVVEFESGAPVPDAKVDWRAATGVLEPGDTFGWFEPSQVARADLVATKTDATGVARIDTGQPVLAVVHDPRRKATASVRVLPGEERRLVLPDAAIQLHLVDFDTRQPLAGLELESWLAREPEALAEQLVTDANGDVAIETPSLPLCIRRPGALAFQHALVALSPGATQCGLASERKTMLRIDALPTAGPLLVGLRACGGRVLLLEEGTRKPIEALVRVRPWYAQDRDDVDALKPDTLTKPSPRLCSGTEAAFVLRSRKGVLELPDSLYAANGSDDGALVEREILFMAAGYHSLHTKITTQRGLPEQSIPVLELKPALQRMLRFVHQDGSPVRRPVEVFSPSENTLLWSSSGAANGVHGPIDWLGGDWIVNKSLRVPASDLERAEVATLTVPDETGAIVLQGIPPGVSPAELVVRGGGIGEPTEYRPASMEAGHCRFEKLPPGTYLVGPIRWVLGAELQSLNFEVIGEAGSARPMRTKLGAGETAVLDWLACWSAGHPVEGQVRVLGPGRVEPLLFPFYVPSGVAAKEAPAVLQHMIFDLRSPRIPLDRDGRYRIEASDPVPALIAICVVGSSWGSWADTGALCVIGTILPGESADIATGSVELSWKGSPRSDPIWVTYDVPAESLAHPLSSAYSTARTRWATATALRLDGIPLRTSALHIGDRIQPVTLELGKVTRIEVDLEALARPAK